MLSLKQLELPLSESLSGTFRLSNFLSPNWNIEVTFWISDRSDLSFCSVIRSAKGWFNL